VDQRKASPLGLSGGAVGSMRRGAPADAGLPDATQHRSGVVIDSDHLAAYAHLCGYTVTNTLPPTYPQVLAFPLTMSVLTGPDFPFPAMGMVHVAEEITVHRAPAVDDVLDFSVHTENLRPHRRGRQFDMVTTVMVSGVEIWQGRSTYLRREDTSATTSPADDSPELPQDTPETTLNAQ